jgi:hypothetical protein
MPLTAMFSPTSSIPITMASIQRVDIDMLCASIKKASVKAYEYYCEAFKLKERSLTVESRHLERIGPLVPRQTIQSGTMPITCREFPDRCFLTRAQQMDLNAVWNLDGDFGSKALAQPLNARRALCMRFANNKADDLTDLFFGYENPELGQEHDFLTALDPVTNNNTKKWDQIDVRMHCFHKAMQEEIDWHETANGMWYLNDYVKFLQTLQSLRLPAMAGAVNLDFTAAPPTDGQREAIKALRAAISIDYRLFSSNDAHELDYNIILQNIPAIGNQAARREAATDEYINNINEVYQNEPQRYREGMPRQSKKKQLACHIFSILSYFFDCRDGGSCQFRWEDWLLAYFGNEEEAGKEPEPGENTDDSPSEFHNFSFAKHQPYTQYVYFDETWFLICKYMQNNFQDAMSAVHYKLFENAGQQVRRFDTLQTTVRKLNERQKSLLNNRASFQGLRNVTPHLSFRKWKHKDFRDKDFKDLTLRERILSQLDDELPLLDPALLDYVRREFNAPDVELFLRIIRCPNVLALRDLAIQHVKSPEQNGITAVLNYFDAAVQGEIQEMLKYVETDKSVYVMNPNPHPTKALQVLTSQMCRWMRKVVEIDKEMMMFKDPLSWKFHMFMTMPDTFPVFQQLFCTQEILNAGSQRPLRFILLQLRMIYDILTTAPVTRCNSLVSHNNNLNHPRSAHEHVQYQNTDLIKPDPLLVTIGTSLITWPLRDINTITKLQRRNGRALFEDNSRQPSTLVLGNLNFFKAGDGADQSTEALLTSSTDSMTSEEANGKGKEAMEPPHSSERGGGDANSAPSRHRPITRRDRESLDCDMLGRPNTELSTPRRHPVTTGDVPIAQPPRNKRSPKAKKQHNWSKNGHGGHQRREFKNQGWQSSGPHPSDPSL